MMRSTFLLAALFASTFPSIAASIRSSHTRQLQTNGTVDDVVVGDDELSTLEAALTAAGLVGVLCPDCNFTLFAPTNEAFAAVDQAFVAKLLTPNWIAHLTNLLAFHATEPTVDRVVSTDLSDGLVLTMLNGENVTVNIDNDGVVVTSEFTEGAPVVQADLIADNGVVHKVSSVLLPQFAVTDLVGLADTPVGSGFTILYELIGIAGIVPDNCTVFAPTDAAFEALGTETLDSLRAESGRDLLTSILVNHVVPAVVPSSLVTDGLTAATLGELSLTFTVAADSIRVNDATVVAADVLANNGIVHAIDTVLMMPSSGSSNTSTSTTPPASGTSNSTESTGGDMGSSPMSPPTGNTVDAVVVADDDLSTLEAALTAAGLVGVLCPDCNFTLFAPTNEAFAALDQDFVATLLTPGWIAHLTNLLSFHATEPTMDRVVSTDLTDGLVLTMLNGENVTLNIDADGVVVTSEFTEGGGAPVVQADLIADNGVVHKVSSVLVPQFVVTDLLGLADTAVGADFTILYELLGIAEIVPDNCTVFAPTNAAFEALGTDTLESLRAESGRDLLTGILVNHVVAGVVPSSLVTDGLTADTLGELSLTFTVEGDAIKVNDATVVAANVLANNGIVHAIDTVLMMPSSGGDENDNDSSGSNGSGSSATNGTNGTTPTGGSSGALSKSKVWTSFVSVLSAATIMLVVM